MICTSFQILIATKRYIARLTGEKWKAFLIGQVLPSMRNSKQGRSHFYSIILSSILPCFYIPAYGNSTTSHNKDISFLPCIYPPCVSLIILKSLLFTLGTRVVCFSINDAIEVADYYNSHHINLVPFLVY